MEKKRHSIRYEGVRLSLILFSIKKGPCLRMVSLLKLVVLYILLVGLVMCCYKRSCFDRVSRYALGHETAGQGRYGRKNTTKLDVSAT